MRSVYDAVSSFRMSLAALVRIQTYAGLFCIDQYFQRLAAVVRDCESDRVVPTVARCMYARSEMEVAFDDVYPF